MTLPHYVCETPMFMPVGTQGPLPPWLCRCVSRPLSLASWCSEHAHCLICAGSVKGLTSRQLEELGCQVILGNTYHLENRPGGRQPK